MYEIVIFMFLPFAEPNENDALTVFGRLESLCRAGISRRARSEN